jgi:thiamine kinase-like enzyme
MNPNMNQQTNNQVETLTQQESIRLSLTNYLQEHNPLHVEGVYLLEPLAAAEYHQNFKFKADGKTYVIRTSVLQLSRKEDQLVQEYTFLKYLSRFQASPKVYHLDMEGAQYPFLIEEFIEGPVFTELSDSNLDKCADALVDLYNVPLEEGHPFEVRAPSYQTDLDYYLGVYNEYKGSEEVSHWATRVEESREAIQSIIDKLQPTLQKVSPRLIRRDANPRNLIDSGDKFTWIDWEVARVDDPVITLASFINETELYDWFEPKLQPEQRKRVSDRFFEKTGIEHGEELLTTRLLLERIWGMIWAIERMYKHKKGELSEHLSTDERLKRYEFIATESYNALQKDLLKFK